MITYQCYKCKTEFTAIDLDDGLTVSARDDLGHDTMTIQVDFECPECGEFSAQHTFQVDVFNEF